LQFCSFSAVYVTVSEPPQNTFPHFYPKQTFCDLYVSVEGRKQIM
jgi:hypothetical protein